MHLVLYLVLLSILVRDIVLGHACLALNILNKYEAYHDVHFPKGVSRAVVLACAKLSPDPVEGAPVLMSATVVLGDHFP